MAPIKIPEGYLLDLDNSTEHTIALKKKKRRPSLYCPNWDDVPVSFPDQDPFEALAGRQPVDGSKLRKTKTSFEDFLKDVVPNSTNISMLLETKHLNKFMTLVNATDTTPPSLFPWESGLSWSYKNGMADSVKERVKKAGGSVTGALRISLAWNNADDLDLAVQENFKDAERHQEIFYPQHKRVSPITAGTLDVGMNARQGGAHFNKDTPVENITYPYPYKDRLGVVVSQFNRRVRENYGYTLEIEYEGELAVFSSEDLMEKGQKDQVCALEFDEHGELTVGYEEGAKKPSRGKVGSIQVNNLDTNKFHSVTTLMKSPNKTGNQHTFFILKDAIVEEAPRGFFNEMLKPQLYEHRRVFEVLADKMTVQHL